MKPKIVLEGESAVFTRQYNPFDSLIIWRQEGPGIQKAFREHEMAARGRTPKQPVVEEAAAVEISSVHPNSTEAVPAEQPTAPATPPPTTEVPNRKLVLKLKSSAPAHAPAPAPAPEKRKLKLVLKNQPSQ